MSRLVVEMAVLSTKKQFAYHVIADGVKLERDLQTRNVIGTNQLQLLSVKQDDHMALVSAYLCVQHYVITISTMNAAGPSQ